MIDLIKLLHLVVRHIALKHTTCRSYLKVYSCYYNLLLIAGRNTGLLKQIMKCDEKNVKISQPMITSFHWVNHLGQSPAKKGKLFFSI